MAKRLTRKTVTHGTFPSSGVRSARKTRPPHGPVPRVSDCLARQAVCMVAGPGGWR
jgi:hypothetical protein